MAKVKYNPMFVVEFATYINSINERGSRKKKGAEYLLDDVKMYISGLKGKDRQYMNLFMVEAYSVAEGKATRKKERDEAIGHLDADFKSKTQRMSWEGNPWP